MTGRRSRTCYACGGTMELSTTSEVFYFMGKEVEIKGIEAFRCPDCGEEIITSQEAKMIEKTLNAISQQSAPSIDVLNLEETARFLRVSNQTVYNMIRDGRIKAYKVGREWRFLRSDIIAYMNSTSNSDFLAMAAKGGNISASDLSVIQAALEENDE